MSSGAVDIYLMRKILPQSESATLDRYLAALHGANVKTLGNLAGLSADEWTNLRKEHKFPLGVINALKREAGQGPVALPGQVAAALAAVSSSASIGSTGATPITPSTAMFPPAATATASSASSSSLMLGAAAARSSTPPTINAVSHHHHNQHQHGQHSIHHQHQQQQQHYHNQQQQQQQQQQFIGGHHHHQQHSGVSFHHHQAPQQHFSHHPHHLQPNQFLHGASGGGNHSGMHGQFVVGGGNNGFGGVHHHHHHHSGSSFHSAVHHQHQGGGGHHFHHAQQQQQQFAMRNFQQFSSQPAPPVVPMAAAGPSAVGMPLGGGGGGGGSGIVGSGSSSGGGFALHAQAAPFQPGQQRNASSGLLLSGTQFSAQQQQQQQQQAPSFVSQLQKPPQVQVQLQPPPQPPRPADGAQCRALVLGWVLQYSSLVEGLIKAAAASRSADLVVAAAARKATASSYAVVSSNTPSTAGSLVDDILGDGATTPLPQPQSSSKNNNPNSSNGLSSPVVVMPAPRSKAASNSPSPAGSSTNNDDVISAPAAASANWADVFLETFQARFTKLKQEHAKFMSAKEADDSAAASSSLSGSCWLKRSDITSSWQPAGGAASAAVGGCQQLRFVEWALAEFAETLLQRSDFLEPSTVKALKTFFLAAVDPSSTAGDEANSSNRSGGNAMSSAATLLRSVGGATTTTTTTISSSSAAAGTTTTALPVPLGSAAGAAGAGGASKLACTAHCAVGLMLSQGRQLGLADRRCLVDRLRRAVTACIEDTNLRKAAGSGGAGDSASSSSPFAATAAFFVAECAQLWKSMMENALPLSRAMPLLQPIVTPAAGCSDFTVLVLTGSFGADTAASSKAAESNSKVAALRAQAAQSAEMTAARLAACDWGLVYDATDPDAAPLSGPFKQRYNVFDGRSGSLFAQRTRNYVAAQSGGTDIAEWFLRALCGSATTTASTATDSSSRWSESDPLSVRIVFLVGSDGAVSVQDVVQPFVRLAKRAEETTSSLLSGEGNNDDDGNQSAQQQAKQLPRRFRIADCAFVTPGDESAVALGSACTAAGAALQSASASIKFTRIYASAHDLSLLLLGHRAENVGFLSADDIWSTADTSNSSKDDDASAAGSAATLDESKRQQQQQRLFLSVLPFADFVPQSDLALSRPRPFKESAAARSQPQQQQQQQLLSAAESRVGNGSGSGGKLLLSDLIAEGAAAATADGRLWSETETGQLAKDRVSFVQGNPASWLLLRYGDVPSRDQVDENLLQKIVSAPAPANSHHHAHHHHHHHHHRQHYHRNNNNNNNKISNEPATGVQFITRARANNFNNSDSLAEIASGARQCGATTAARRALLRACRERGVACAAIVSTRQLFASEATEAGAVQRLAGFVAAATARIASSSAPASTAPAHAARVVIILDDCDSENILAALDCAAIKACCGGTTGVNVFALTSRRELNSRFTDIPPMMTEAQFNAAKAYLSSSFSTTVSSSSPSSSSSLGAAAGGEMTVAGLLFLMSMAANNALRGELKSKLAARIESLFWNYFSSDEDADGQQNNSNNNQSGGNSLAAGTSNNNNTPKAPTIDLDSFLAATTSIGDTSGGAALAAHPQQQQQAKALTPAEKKRFVTLLSSIALLHGFYGISTPAHGSSMPRDTSSPLLLFGLRVADVWCAEDESSSAADGSNNNVARRELFVVERGAGGVMSGVRFVNRAVALAFLASVLTRNKINISNSNSNSAIARMWQSAASFAASWFAPFAELTAQTVTSQSAKLAESLLRMIPPPPPKHAAAFTSAPAAAALASTPAAKGAAGNSCCSSSSKEPISAVTAVVDMPAAAAASGATPPAKQLTKKQQQQLAAQDKKLQQQQNKKPEPSTSSASPTGKNIGKTETAAMTATMVATTTAAAVVAAAATVGVSPPHVPPQSQSSAKAAAPPKPKSAWAASSTAATTTTTTTTTTPPHGNETQVGATSEPKTAAGGLNYAAVASGKKEGVTITAEMPSLSSLIVDDVLPVSNKKKNTAAATSAAAASSTNTKTEQQQQAPAPGGKTSTSAAAAASSSSAPAAASAPSTSGKQTSQQQQQSQSQQSQYGDEEDDDDDDYLYDGGDPSMRQCWYQKTQGYCYNIRCERLHTMEFLEWVPVYVGPGNPDSWDYFAVEEVSDETLQCYEREFDLHGVMPPGHKPGGRPNMAKPQNAYKAAIDRVQPKRKK